MWTNINSNKLQVIVFDLYGTLTNNIASHPKHIQYRNAYILSHSNVLSTRLLPESTDLALKACGINPLRYYIQRNLDLDFSEIHSTRPEITHLLKELKNRGMKLVLHSETIGSQVQKTLEILGVFDLFDLILTEEYGFKKPSATAVQLICKECRCIPSEIVMIGNDYVKDMLPAILLGGSGIQIDSEYELEKALSVLNNTNSKKAS